MFRIKKKHYKINDFLTPTLQLQKGLSEKEFWEYLCQFHLSDADERARNELKNYLEQDFRRFCYTFSMLPDIEANYKVFEIGGNPYYLTALIKKYTAYDVYCSNLFNDNNTRLFFDEQEFINEDESEKIKMPWVNLNIEKNWYGESAYNIVCFCEVIEHMIESPLRALLNINKMLQDNGYLIMSTPNVNRLENVAKMIAGANIYDPYSGYGQYGRHNREYNKHELANLLKLCGFEIEVMFSANVHEEWGFNYYDVNKLIGLIDEIPNRSHDLGQYIFIRAKKVEKVEEVNAPEWLYRSMLDNVVTVGEAAK